ncbi:MAG: hypothetical protein PWQ69_1775 [Methanomicrobiaceae archaeon]|jgi:hypothetical protein|nr:hypothetical protein [Methanomicrobiaceae archaeon]
MRPGASIRSPNGARIGHHCGYISIGGASYCGDCGELIHIPRILTHFEKFIELKVPQSVHKTHFANPLAQ